MAIRELTLRNKVFALEWEMLKQPQVELPLFHHFAPGIYARELHIPKGVLLTGKIHKHKCLSIMPKGEMFVSVDDDIVRLKAPFINVAPAGTKRIAYALEDSIWITVHATNETDVVELEKQLVCDTDKEYLEFCEAIKLLDNG